MPARTPISEVFPEAKKAHEDSEKKNTNQSTLYGEFLEYQKSIKENQSSFYSGEDFLRHLELGKEFDQNTQYNSRSKVKDSMGFEYSIPPKEQSINARFRNQYQKWKENDRLMEEEEENAERNANGFAMPLRLEQLTYDISDDIAENYDTYYKKIKELSVAEKKYEDKLNNTADSALISGGNVAYGKAVAKGDSDVEFERRASISSLGDVEKLWVKNNKNVSLLTVTKMVKKGFKKKKQQKEDTEKSSDEDYDKLDVESSSERSISGSIRGLRGLLDGAKDRYRSLRM